MKPVSYTHLDVYKRQVHNEVEYLLKAVDIGIDGYIMKDAESAELKKAINCSRQNRGSPGRL